MNEQIYLTIIEIFVGLVIEGVLLSMIFAYIQNQSSEKQNRNLKDEMNNIETQNKFQFEQMTTAIQEAKTEVINQVKEANYDNKGGNSK
jgi:hypothetical protein